MKKYAKFVIFLKKWYNKNVLRVKGGDNMEKTEKNNKVIQVRFEGEKEARKRAIERRKEIKSLN